MANEIQEFFLGQNKQEIENERKKTRTLMEYFPYSMGNTDRTNYILRKDGNQNQNESFGSNAIDKPDKIVISNEGEKSQEQNRGKMPKLPDFGNRNIETPFTGNGFMQADSLYALNNTKRDNVSFALGKRKSIDNIMSGTAINGNFRLDSINTSDHSDLLWSDRRQERTYYNQKPGIYGIQPTINYSKQINELKSQLPQRMLRILNESGTEIRVLDNLHYVDKDRSIKQPLGIYNSNKITLDSKHVNIETLLAETIHAVQDYLGMTDNGLSNLEFQEHVLKDLYNYYQYKFNGGEWKNFSLSSSDKYINTITSFDDRGFLNINKFISNIGSCIDDFQRAFSANNSYQETEIKNFDYQWEYMLKLLGIPYNKL